MIIFENKGFQTRSDVPFGTWETDSKIAYVVSDNSTLAKKIKEYYPNYDFILNDDGGLVDVVNTYTFIELTSSQQREQAYKTMIFKADGATPLISWGGENLTVDTTNEMFNKYFAEGNTEMCTALQTLIQGAKAYIRELYPDDENE